MKENVMNIIITTSNIYVNCVVVMLESLYYNNNNTRIKVYCMYYELSSLSMNKLVEITKKYNQTIRFIKLERDLYSGIINKSEGIYGDISILFAHNLLPLDVGKALYLHADVIVDNDIKELYELDFEDKSIIACSKYYVAESIGGIHPIGACSEKGHYFDSGVLMMNFDKMRQNVHIRDEYDRAIKVIDNPRITKGLKILNVVYENDVKYVDGLKYNFHLTAYECLLKDKLKVSIDEPIIIHYPRNDNYNIGRFCEVFDLFLDRQEFEKLQGVGLVKQCYETSSIDRVKFVSKWWEYAKRTEVYSELLNNMLLKKQHVIESLIGNKSFEELSNEYINVKQRIYNLIADKVFLQERDCNISYSEIKNYIDSLPPDEAIKALKIIHEKACTKIKKKKRIRIAFLVYSTSEWQCESLYRLLEKNNRFEPIVCACGYNYASREIVEKHYNDVIDYFSGGDKYYNLTAFGLDECNEIDKWCKTIDVFVDITPFQGSIIPAQLRIEKRNAYQLTIHIPYGVYLVDKRDIRYGNGSFWNSCLFELSILHCISSDIQKEMLKEEQRLKGYNAVYTGIPKIDGFYSRVIPHKNKCIIWAPHFNMEKNMNGTFNHNYKFILEMISKYKDVKWIFRPHPRMAKGTIDEGIFANLEEYKQYLAEIESFTNATVQEFGEYTEMFLSSDAMITDCGSFLYEYQFVRKPMLRLLPKHPRSMNILGETLGEKLYNCRGDDYKTIDEFVKMVISENDPMKAERDVFIDKYIDYKSKNSMLSSEYIVKYLKESINKKDWLY